MSTPEDQLRTHLKTRYNKDLPVDGSWTGLNQLATMAGRGSCRTFKANPIDLKLIKVLCAVALASPTKSDLQQRDIIIVQSDRIRSNIHDLLGPQSWVKHAPCLLVFCGNNRRQRALHDIRDHAFANDHFDAFFNAAVDAGIALSAFVTAAEATGLGCCPISAIRNHPGEVSDLLDLPDHVFPVAGLAVGYPSTDSREISPRLPLDLTFHTDSYSDENLTRRIIDYDVNRDSTQPFDQQRMVDEYGSADPYVWSEDKARQYSKPERESFGRFIRKKGFNLS